MAGDLDLEVRTTSAGDRDNHKTPLAPRTIPKSYAPAPFKNRHEKANKSLVYILIFLVLVTLTFLIAFSILLRVTSPHLNLSITSIHFNNVTSSSVNATLLADLTISNRNYGPFTYENCKAVRFEKAVMIGGGDISGGLVEARSSKSVRVLMSFDSKKSNTTEYIEAFVFVKMSGRVRVMKIRNWEKTIEMSCTVRIDLMRKSVTSLLC